MIVVTTETLLTKYKISKDDALALLTKLSPNVLILPATSNYMAIKVETDKINDDILLVGGHDVVPFAVLANPCNDPDAQVWSDAPYACTQDPLFYIPDKCVGRLPDEALNPGYDYLETVVQNQVAHINGKPTTSGWFNIVASVWKDISDFMNTNFNMSNQEIAPPAHQPDISILGKKYHYINLHGAQTTPYYYGQAGGTYPIALEPKPGYFKDGIVFTEACYGGYLLNRNRGTSIPLMAMLSGAVAVVSSTAVAYGPASPPPDGADLLSYCFYTHLLKGETVGQSFLNAKKDFSTALIKRTGNLLPSNKKTLLEFNLYSTPIISV